MLSSTRCAWCGKSEGDIEHVKYEVWNSIGTKMDTIELSVHPNHRAAVDNFVKFENRFGRIFVILISILSVAAITFLIIGYLFGINMVIPLLGITAGFGVVFSVLPFAAPPTFDLVGLKWSRRISRGCGLVLLIIPVMLIF